MHQPLDATPTVETVRGVARQCAAAVAVVISQCDGAPHATTASSVVVASLEPPLIALFATRETRMHQQLTRSGRFTVSILPAAEHQLASRFGRRARPTGWAGLQGVAVIRRDPAPPVLACAVAWLDAEVAEVVPMGDHDCIVAHVLAAAREAESQPLVAYRGRLHELGSPVAPTPWLTLAAVDLAAAW